MLVTEQGSQSWKENTVTGHGQQLRGETVVGSYHRFTPVPPLTINVPKYLAVESAGVGVETAMFHSMAVQNFLEVGFLSGCRMSS